MVASGWILGCFPPVRQQRRPEPCPGSKGEPRLGDTQGSTLLSAGVVLRRGRWQSPACVIAFRHLLTCQHKAELLENGLQLLQGSPMLSRAQKGIEPRSNKTGLVTEIFLHVYLVDQNRVSLAAVTIMFTA